MRSYTVQRPPYPGSAVVLPEGFCWWALLFGPLWFLFHGLWVSAILLFLVHAVIAAAVGYFAVPEAFAAAISAALSVLVGFNARDWWRLMLNRQGFSFEPVVLARSVEQAELTLMQRAYSEGSAA